jgi:tRNA(Ile)-lysidine synthase
LRKLDFAAEMERRFATQLSVNAWFRPGLKIGVAVSGGADSIALLRMMSAASAKLGMVLSAIHFNHKLRGIASDTDQAFVAGLAETLGVTSHIGRADVAEKAKQEKINLEDAARRARYGFFERLTGQRVVELVATAHTMDDQAETVLAHILRGTGIAGLAGIHPVAEHVVRPLLQFRREDLRRYLRAKKQLWREDATNRDNARTRARMRKKLLPLLEKEFNPMVVEHLAALSDRAREQALFVEQLAGQISREYVVMDGEDARIGLKELLNPLGMEGDEASGVLRAKLIQEIAARMRQQRGQISAAHIEAVVAFAKKGEPGKRLQLPGGIDVLRERAELVFFRRESIQK